MALKQKRTLLYNEKFECHFLFWAENIGRKTYVDTFWIGV